MEYPKEIAETVHGGPDRIATRQHRVIGALYILLTSGDPHSDWPDPQSWIEGSSFAVRNRRHTQTPPYRLQPAAVDIVEGTLQVQNFMCQMRDVAFQEDACSATATPLSTRPSCGGWAYMLLYRIPAQDQVSGTNTQGRSESNLSIQGGISGFQRLCGCPGARPKRACTDTATSEAACRIFWSIVARGTCRMRASATNSAS